MYNRTQGRYLELVHNSDEAQYPDFTMVFPSLLYK